MQNDSYSITWVCCQVSRFELTARLTLGTWITRSVRARFIFYAYLLDELFCIVGRVMWWFYRNRLNLGYLIDLINNPSS